MHVGGASELKRRAECDPIPPNCAILSAVYAGCHLGRSPVCQAAYVCSWVESPYPAARKVLEILRRRFHSFMFPPRCTIMHGVSARNKSCLIQDQHPFAQGYRIGIEKPSGAIIRW